MPHPDFFLLSFNSRNIVQIQANLTTKLEFLDVHLTYIQSSNKVIQKKAQA